MAFRRVWSYCQKLFLPYIVVKGRDINIKYAYLLNRYTTASITFLPSDFDKSSMKSNDTLDQTCEGTSSGSSNLGYDTLCFILLTSITHLHNFFDVSSHIWQTNI